MAEKLATVFGGAGFIGRYVVQRLARAGWRIRVPARNPDSALFLKPLGDVGQIVPMAANIRNELSVRRAVEGAGAVFNLVGILSERGRQSFDAVHREGAERIARIAAEMGAARLLHISALGADPQSPSKYARSKAAGEAAVRAAFPGATLFRPSIVFGPEDDFFNRFARMTRLLPALPLIGGGKTRFQPVYVGDVAEALVAALADPKTMGQIFELGGPQTYSFRQLMEILLAAVGRKRWLVPVPFPVATAQGAVLSLLPNPPLTRDQVKLLRRDNVISGLFPGLTELGVRPTALEAVIPTYLDRFRPGGWYSSSRTRQGPTGG
ncbi:MAG: 3-beta-hydroxy-Delta(5)-steroid dehydrogenase [Rhodospirillales bacterium]|nr:3-beta-hydroxy-Delta(5)-steroid dehydrogenase [Rhodospirillales bacterium]